MKNVSYSQCNNKNEYLDILLNNYLNNKENGFYIELGANDGLCQSNSAYFEFSKNYRGILIEPSVKGYELCKINRPNSICINCACVSNEYKEETVSGNFINNLLMASINNTRQKEIDDILVPVTANTLENILDNILENKKEQLDNILENKKEQLDNILENKKEQLDNILENKKEQIDNILENKKEQIDNILENTIKNVNNKKQIDFLSLDVEGYELNVLKGINLNKYRPHFLLIEIYSINYDEVVSFLMLNNYSLIINLSNYNLQDNPIWDGTHNDFLFCDNDKYCDNEKSC